MATEQKPAKSILKASSSFDKHADAKKSAQFDEMNILATYHPADKDYGHQKIDEPSTPYNREFDEESEEMEEDGHMDPNSLAARLETGGKPRVMEEESESEEEDESEEGKVHRKSFEVKRKAHYNEFHAVKLARQLLEREDEEDEEEEEEEEAASASAASSH